MYSFKEKKKWLAAMLNTAAAACDLALLRQADPNNTQLVAFSVNPARHAEEILFQLLDFKTAEEIRVNRRACVAQAETVAAAEETDTPSETAISKEATDAADKELPASEAMDDTHEAPDSASPAEDGSGQATASTGTQKKSKKKKSTRA